MSWQKEIDELERRRAARAPDGRRGGHRAPAQARQADRARAPRRAGRPRLVPRVPRAPWGTASTTASSSPTSRRSPRSKASCRVGGRKVVVTAGDFTVRGGSAGGGHELGSELGAARRALEWRVPLVRLIDSAGGSVRSFEEIGRTYLPDGNVWTATDVRLLRAVPVVSAVMGSAAGLPAVNACMAHFSLMLRGIGHVFPGGPPVVKAALGYDVTKEDLGGDRIHVNESGVIDNLAETEDDAFAQIRRFLSYLPDNVWEMAPRGDTGDDPARRDESLLSAIPRDRRFAFDPYAILGAVVDRGSFFEIAPAYGRSRITGLGAVQRLSGRHHVQQPEPSRRRHRRRGRREVDPPDPALRHLPSAADLARRRARRDGRARVGAARHRARRRAAPVRGVRQHDAVVHGRAAAASTASPASRTIAPPACSAATPGRRRAGARCTSRAAPRPPIGARSRPPPIRRPSAARSRRGSRRWRRRSAPPRPPARTSSIRARRAQLAVRVRRGRAAGAAHAARTDRVPVPAVAGR